MTDPARQPPHERRQIAEKMQRVVLRSGFNIDAYWKKIRREIAEEQGKPEWRNG